MILSIDVETSSLPAKGMTIESPQYPWPVQVGCVLFDFDGHDRATFGSRVRAPDGKKIAPAATEIHGISSRDAARSGIPEILALSLITNLAGEAKFLTGFNIEFDLAIIQAAIIRNGRDPSKLTRPGLQVLDLMKPSTAFCKLPRNADDGSYKWPHLHEALAGIRSERPANGHHDALKDAYSAKRLFLSLHHRGALDIPAAA